MAEVYEVAVPGTGKTIVVEPVLRTLTAIPGREPRSLLVPGELPVKYRGIVIGSVQGMHWARGPNFGPPVSPPECEFLATAIHQIGELACAGWLGVEPAVDQDALPLPDRRQSDHYSTSVDPAMKNLVLQLLGKERKAGNPVWDVVRDGEWKEAQRMRLEAIEYVKPARDRLRVVFDLIHSAFASGMLVARLQPLKGGGVEVRRPTDDWLAPRPTIDQRLVSCQMSADHPFDLVRPTHRIYVETPGLNRFLSQLRKSAVVAEPQNKPTKTIAHSDAFQRRVKDAVKADPHGPSQRAYLIKEGQDVYRLPKEAAEKLFKDAIDHAGVPHGWSRPGPSKTK